MHFSDTLEKLIDKSAEILQKGERCIAGDYTLFNTIFIENISPDKLNVEIQLAHPEMAKVMSFDLNRYYQDRLYNLEKTLEYRIWHYENVPDDMPFIGIYEMNYGVYTMEYSQFGMETLWPDNDYPVCSKPIINDIDDLKKIEIPDFFTTGYMPKLIEEYQEIKELLKGRMQVGIRKTFHGFTQFAADICGIENFYMSLLTDQEFVAGVFELCWNYLDNWVSGWEKLHNQKYGLFHLGEDPINTKSMFSPDVFKEQILPWQIKAGEKYKSIHWHSCGDVNNILDTLHVISGLELVELGPATDVLHAADVFEHTGVKLYKCADVIKELMTDNLEARRKFVKDTLAASKKAPVKVLLETPSLKKALELLEIFRET
jgi:hypothetical protein